MSIFDRLISALSGGDETAAPATASAAGSEDGRQRRFMGREGSEAKAQEVPVEVPGFAQPTEVWLHVQPSNQRLLRVDAVGIAEGEELTHKMTQDLQRKGLCEAVAYHAGYDEYWKMPSQEAILRTPSLYSIETAMLHKMELETRLVKQGEPRGFWMRVRIRSEAELPGDELPAEQQA